MRVDDFTMPVNRVNTAPETEVPDEDHKELLERVTFVSTVNALLKTKVFPELIALNSYSISDGKGGRILL